MFLRVTAILLVYIEYLLAAENTTTTKSFELPALSTSFGNTTTRETEATQNTSNDVTENSLVVSITPPQMHQESQNIEQKQNNYNFLRPRGKTKFIFENIVHASSNTEAPRNNKEITQDQRPNYSVDLKLGDLQRQQLQFATEEKEEFIQSELHNLAKDIAETELNREAGKTNSNPRPSSWKSFFSSIFPQGILNVFHLSVAGEPQKSRELQTSSVRVNRIINPNDTYQNRRIITERPTLPITPPMTPPLPEAPPISETPSSIPITESVPAITPETQTNAENKNGTVMTNKDVFDINSAAEVSELPFEAVIPMESRNVFHIHPLNCEDNCNEESEDYVDQLSETGDDNVVAFSREAPKNIFYPTAKPLPYEHFQPVRNSDIFYSGTGTQTSEEIIRENTKDFGKKLPYHPAKQLDDFQKEVEKQFDHNEVRIDAEAASRKFLKHFKGKFVRPQQSNSDTQLPGQSNTFKGPNHFELISSTLKPEINFQSQPSPIKPESKLHTYIFSAGFNSNSANTEPPKLEGSDSLSKYTTFKEKPQNGHVDNSNSLQGPIDGEKSPSPEDLSVPYPDVKPENLLRAYLFTSNNNNNSVLNAGLKPAAIISSWIAPNKNSDTKENVKIIPNQIQSGNQLNTNIYSGGSYDNEGPRIVENDNENNVQGQIKDEDPLKSNAAYEVNPSNLKPESLLHTYIFSKYDTNDQNNESDSNAQSVRTSKPEAVFSKNPGGQLSQGLSSFRPTQVTYLCTKEQLKSGDCSYSTTPLPESSFQQKELIQIQKSLEQPVKHTKPYVYYNFPGGPPLLSKNPIRVEQPVEDSQQSESYVIPESYQQRQQYLQDHQQQLNQQQEHFQQQQIQEYQQKLQYQQQQEYLQKQREQMQKQQEQLQQYQLKQQQQLKQYQQVQQQQRDQQQQQLQQQQMQHQQQLQYHQQVQQQQRDQQQLQKQQQQLQQYQQEQQTQRDQQQLLQLQNQQKDQQQKQQQENQQHYEKEQKLIRYNTVQVEKIVPKPYPVHVKEIVEKIVERPVPVERIVEKPVNVPYPVREVVEKIVDRPYPVEKIIDRPVHIPYPVQVDHFIDRPYAVRVPVAVAVPVPVHQYIDRPYPVEKIVEKPIHVPYPVDKVVEKIIEKHIPVEVERIVEKPAAAPKKPAPKKHPKKPEPYTYAAIDGHTNKSKENLDDLLELVPPPVDQEDHDSYKTIPDDIEFILLDDYNGPVPLDHQAGYPWNKPEKRAAKNHNIKRSPEFRRNLRVEYGFRPPLIPSIEIGGEKGFI